MSSGTEFIKSVKVDGIKVDIVGCWDEETPENKFDFYDLFVDGDCINMGEPCYTFPKRKDICAFVEVYKKLLK